MISIAPLKRTLSNSWIGVLVVEPHPQLLLFPIWMRSVAGAQHAPDAACSAALIGVQHPLVLAASATASALAVLQQLAAAATSTTSTLAVVQHPAPSLAKSVEQTLFFAGETLDVEESSSVGGALSTGQRAAKELLDGS